MLKHAVIVGVATIVALVAARGVLDMASEAEPAPRAAIAVEHASPPVVPNPSDASVSKAADGHYWAHATVSGRSVKFLVDTGATTVALTPSDATRLGVDVGALDYAYPVTTANGQTRAARVTLEYVAVAGARVDNVDAFVLQDGLDVSLLGMSYLGRLSRFEATKTALILRP